jgi:hypothetical protein
MLAGFTGAAQHTISSGNQKKSSKLYDAGLVQIDLQEFEKAREFFLQSLQFNPSNTNALLALAEMNLETREYSSCVFYIERALLLDSNLLTKVYRPLIRAYLGDGQFTKAKLFLEKLPHLDFADQKFIYEHRSLIDFSQHVSNQNIQEGLRIKNLGEVINSPSSEYFPSVFLNDSSMIFTRRVDQERNEDFYFSTFNNNQWSKALPLSGKVNTGYNEGGQKITNDGSLMVFTGCNYPEGRGSCDIYYAFQEHGVWSERKPMGEGINSEFWESAPCLSPDKSTLYFSSNRPGGYGGMDIYVAYSNGKGSWSEPKNLGSSINTSGDEMFPFIHSDNISLYFTSNGWQGMGGSDIFVARKLANGFSIPLNLGYPINTIDNESGLVVSATGKTAFFSSDRTGGLGKMDIYEFTLAPLVQAFPVVQEEKMILQNIQFETGKWQLTTSSLDPLNALAYYLVKNPAIKVQINGHTDSIGKEEDNLQLSTQRAKAVVDFLIGKGISPDRLSFKGFGATQPISDNSTEAGRAKNRRTEMLILSNK